MSKYILLKMIYLADRESLKLRNCPITGDEPHSMQWGPVPGHIYDLTKGGIRHSDDWRTSIATHGNRTMVLKSDPGRDDLSDKELAILDGVYEKFKGFDFGQMKNYCHALPEYDRSVGKGSRPIGIESLLRILGKSPDEIQVIADEEFESARLNDAFRA